MALVRAARARTAPSLRQAGRRRNRGIPPQFALNSRWDLQDGSTRVAAASLRWVNQPMAWGVPWSCTRNSSQ